MAPIGLKRGRFFGRVLGRRTIGALEFTETEYASGQRLAQHDHADTTLFVVTSGMVHERSGDTQLRHRAWTAVLVPGGQPHSTVLAGSRPRVLNVQFAQSWLQSLCASPCDRRRVLSRSLAGPTLARVYAALKTSSAGEAELERVVATLIGPPRSAGAGRAHARAAAQLIERRNMQGSHFVSQIACELGAERTALAHAFRREFGCSMREYGARVRFANAFERVLDADHPLVEIAIDCGYADQSHMSRDFRRRAGQTPRVVRSAIRQGRITTVQDCPSSRD